jgi:hypothetical protein
LVTDLSWQSGQCAGLESQSTYLEPRVYVGKDTSISAQMRTEGRLNP